MKVTIEMTLSIPRLLTRHPITWTLLSIQAKGRPALCYCSVLAVSISH